MRLRVVAIGIAALLCGSSSAAAAPSTGGAAMPVATGGTAVGALPPGAGGRRARVIDGVAVPPRGAPDVVRRVILAGNDLQAMPYRYGGGHASFDDTGYDCSGTVSYALNGGDLLDSPLDSSGLARWGMPGRGRWLTVYANKGHTYLVVAGLRLDTSGSDGRGPRWQRARRSSAGFVARHPAGL